MSYKETYVTGHGQGSKYIIVLVLVANVYTQAYIDFYFQQFQETMQLAVAGM